MAKPARDTAHTGFLHHASYRWAKISVFICIIAIVAYVQHQPIDGPNGGTWLGYTLGTIGALFILWLTWLGVRKRRYRSSVGTVKGWTSAHVYLGLSLIVIATLHCGFQFGWNIHTAAYALMMLVIGSGIYGIVMYSRMPETVTRMREGGTRNAWIQEVFDLNDQSIKLADRISPDVHRKIVASVAKIRIGGNLSEQLFGAKNKFVDLDGLADTLKERIQSIRKESEITFNPNVTAQNTVMFMAGQLTSDKGEKEAARTQQLLDLIARRNALVDRINRDITQHARMQVWLLFHVPLTFALLAALIAHIVSVFFYW